MNDLEELLGALERPKRDPNITRGMGAWEMVDYEASLEASTEVKLSKKQRDELQSKCPFYIIAGEGKELTCITSVSRSYYTSDKGEETVVDRSLAIYESVESYEESCRKNMAVDARKFFKKHGKDIEIYTKFRDENPEFFI